MSHDVLQAQVGGRNIERVSRAGSPPARKTASTLANSSGVPSNNTARIRRHPSSRQGVTLRSTWRSPPSTGGVIAGLTRCRRDRGAAPRDRPPLRFTPIGQLSEVPDTRPRATLPPRLCQASKFAA